MTLVPTDGSKDISKKYEEPGTEIRDLIRSKTNNSGDCDEKYLKIMFDLDDDLPKKVLELNNSCLSHSLWRQEIVSLNFLGWTFV